MKKLSFLILILLFIAACNNTASTEQSNTENTEQEEPQEGLIEIAAFKVTGMHCEACEKAISSALLELDGVEDAKASFEHGQAKAKFEPAKVSVDDLKAAIEGKGYGVVEVEIIKMEKQAGEPGE